MPRRLGLQAGLPQPPPQAAPRELLPSKGGAPRGAPKRKRGAPKVRLFCPGTHARGSPAPWWPWVPQQRCRSAWLELKRQGQACSPQRELRASRALQAWQQGQKWHTLEKWEGSRR